MYFPIHNLPIGKKNVAIKDTTITELHSKKGTVLPGK